MRRMFMERIVWGVAFALFWAGTMFFAYSHAPHAAAPVRLVTSSSPPMPTPIASLPITQVVLERVGGGPQFEWQKVHILLQRPQDTNSEAADEFAHLSRWLETSGFFTRKSGYVDPQKLFPGDVGYLMVKVTRGGKVTQVWSYNRDRDDELWETETMIRGTEATILRDQADLARIQQWNKQPSVR